MLLEGQIKGSYVAETIYLSRPGSASSAHQERGIPARHCGMHGSLQPASAGQTGVSLQQQELRFTFCSLSTHARDSLYPRLLFSSLGSRPSHLHLTCTALLFDPNITILRAQDTNRSPTV